MKSLRDLNELKFLFKNNKLRLISLIVLIIGLIVGVFLIQKPQIFKSRANIDVSSAFSISGNQGESVNCSGNTCETEATDVTIEVIDPNIFLQE